MTRAATGAGATILQSHMHQFGEGLGFTGVLLLAESHISVHTWPESEYAAFDIFMCGEPHLQCALDILRNTNQGGCFHIKLLQRGRSNPNQKNPEEIAENLLNENRELLQHLMFIFNTTKKQTILGLSETIKFLLLQAQNSDSLIPSYQIQRIWQEFVLFTRCYEQFCHQYLTRFVHFQPRQQMEINIDKHRYKKTVSEYLKHFGAANEEFWNGINQSL